jgi:hypothetical protein
VQERLHEMKGTNMKTKIKDKKFTIINEPSENLDDDLREEYDLSKMNLKPNPYIKNQETLQIELSADVAKYFKTSQAVNQFLRNQIKLFQKVMM